MVRSNSETVDNYLQNLPEHRRKIIEHVRNIILENLPKGYKERMNWGMISYEVPLEDYSETYNGQPLGYIALAAQKKYYSLYLMSMYQNEEKKSRLVNAYNDMGIKPDMGKSCIRFTSVDELPVDTIGDIIASTSPEEFLYQYQQSRSG